MKRMLKAALAAGLGGWPGYHEALLAQHLMPIVCYHRVGSESDTVGLSVTTEEFEWQMRQIATSRYYRPVDIEEYEAIWSGEADYGDRLPVLVSFDDGYRDNLEAAAPIMRRYGVSAILFVATGVLDDQPLWYDRIVRLLAAGDKHRWVECLDAAKIAPLNSENTAQAWIAWMMSLDQSTFQRALDVLRAVSSNQDFATVYMSEEDLRAWCGLGMSIGAHTVSHPRLSALAITAATDEVRRSRDRLQAITGQPVRYFAYPFGGAADYLAEHGRMLKDLGFSMAFTTLEGGAEAGTAPFAIRRKCISSGLFSLPLIGQSRSLFYADIAGMKARLRRGFRLSVRDR